MTKKSEWCLYTAFDANYRDIARISMPTMREYAQRYGMDFRHFEFSIQNRHPSWGKIKIAQDLLRDYETIMWVDCDALFVRYDDDIRKCIEPGKYIYAAGHPTPMYLGWPHALDGGFISIGKQKHLNAGVFVLVRADWTLQFLKAIWSNPKYIQASFWEQSAINEWLGINTGINPASDPLKTGVIDTPNLTELAHVGWLDLNWNSLPGIAIGRNPIIHHFVALAPDLRKQLMYFDRRLRVDTANRNPDGWSLSLATHDYALLARDIHRPANGSRPIG